MKIWLDDQLDVPDLPRRHTPPGWVGAKNAYEFKKLITEAVEKGEEIEGIDFDNDLGEEIEGRHLMKWLIDTFPEVAMDTIMLVHTENPEARAEMAKLIRDCREHPQELLEKKNRPSYENLFTETDKLK